jgi:hypothetical protein
VRTFSFGAPLGRLQTIFLDFDQDRSLGAEVDFLEDLREYGLSSPEAPALEQVMRDLLVRDIAARVRGYYGLEPDGRPGPDPVNVDFVTERPLVHHSRLCVGGESTAGADVLGAASLDVNNLDETSDECGREATLGVFPQAIDDLWGDSPTMWATFAPLDPDWGGIPVGEHPLDAGIVMPSGRDGPSTRSELVRGLRILNAADAFAQVVATAIAHETGHLLGLTAPGPAPAGLFGGVSLDTADHNLTAGDRSPPDNFLMNAGASFSFEQMTGRRGTPLPTFRPLNWAYLRDRVVLSDRVTGLYPAPVLRSVEPGARDSGEIEFVFVGENFLDDAAIELRHGQGPPIPIRRVEVVDPGEVRGALNTALAPPGRYDVHLVNGDGQVVVLEGGLELL